MVDFTLSGDGVARDGSARSRPVLHNAKDLIAMLRIILTHGLIAGLVTIGDVVKRRIAAVEAEHQAMRDYITMA